MKALLQRVSRAEVRVGGRTAGRIGAGLLVLLGVARGDGEAECDALAEKTAKLRIFPDGEGRMDRAVGEAGGAVLCVSQFTLLADTRRGRRPDFTPAAPPDAARPLYERFCARLREAGLPVETGVFGATMDVELVNDGPVTVLLERTGARDGASD